MLKKYLWGAIVPVLAIFILSGSGARPKKEGLPKQNADTVKYQSIMIKQTSKDTSITFAGPNGRIAGIVVDLETKEPIPGVNITIVGTNFNAETDSAGKYTIVNVPVGTYSVEAQKKGYQSQRITGLKSIMSFRTPVNFRLRSSVIEMEGTVVKKPNIYLYPTKKETLTVKIHTKGKITTSIPEYNTGWNIVVAPGGKINDTYDYLFYEAKVDYNFTLDAGWVLQSSDFDRRMNEILVNIGLNDKERADFMDYWPKRMDWKKKYCAAYYLKRNEIDQAIPLTISKTPESLLRLFFKFVPTDTLVTVPEPKIEKFKRIGFTVVEWGGILENEK